MIRAFPVQDDEVLHFKATRAWKDNATLKFTSFDDGNGSQEGLICLAKMLLELAQDRGDFDGVLDHHDIEDVKFMQSILERVKVR